jgi:hypothetical protein
MSKQLYAELVEVATEYLGPAADRFMSRHIETHLHVKPAEVTVDKLPELTDWLKVSMSLLTPDSRIVDDFCSRVKGLQK